jgi:hypothetical protein
MYPSFYEAEQLARVKHEDLLRFAKRRRVLNALKRRWSTLGKEAPSPREVFDVAQEPVRM